MAAKARRGDVASGSNPRSDAGTALAAAGASLAQAAQGLFSQGGVMNTTVGLIRTDSVGMARVEQVGTTKVTNVGATFATQVGTAWSLTVGQTAKTQVGKDAIVDVGEAMQVAVGKTKTIDVGEVFEITAGQRFMITVGGCRLQMDSSGIVLLQGSQTTIVKGPSAQLTLGSGPVLYTPALVQGSQPANPAACMRRMSDSGSPFVQG